MGYNYNIELTHEEFEILYQIKVKYDVDTVQELLNKAVKDYIHDEKQDL